MRESVTTPIGGCLRGAVIVSLASFQACESQPSSQAIPSVYTLETGRVLVANPAPPETASLRLVEELRLGAAEGAGQDVFGDLGSLAVDGEGTIFVADFAAGEIKAFSSDGELRGLTLRKGQGPGEIRFYLRRVDLLWQEPDRLWIGDPPHVRLMDLSGDVREIRYDLGLSALRARADTSGFVFREAADLTNDRRVRWIEALRLTPTDSLSVEATIPLETVRMKVRLHRIGNSELREMQDAPLRSGVIWDVDPAGDLWLAHAGTYRIHRVTLRGDTVRTVELPLRPEPLRGAARERAAENSAWSPEELPAHKPLIADLRVDREGWLWVRRTASGSDLPLVDVFDKCGRHLGSAPANLADRQPWLALGTARLLGVVRDELDVEYVVRLRLVRDDGAPVASAPCTF